MKCSVKVKASFTLVTKTKDASKIQKFGKKYTNVTLYLRTVIFKDSQGHMILIFFLVYHSSSSLHKIANILFSL